MLLLFSMEHKKDLNAALFLMTVHSDPSIKVLLTDKKVLEILYTLNKLLMSTPQTEWGEFHTKVYFNSAIKQKVVTNLYCDVHQSEIKKEKICRVWTC